MTFVATGLVCFLREVLDGRVWEYLTIGTVLIKLKPLLMPPFPPDVVQM